MRPVEHWTEAQLGLLGPDEYDVQEYKGSGLMVAGGQVHTDFLPALSKQLSAFANGAGGHIVLGLDDDGRIDGGIPVDLKKGGTRSWLEDVVPGLCDPPLAAFNVHEILRQSDGSAILPGHAVYVIEVPPSDLAPHQALDLRYYLRIAGKSRPMGNVHLHDVLRRTRNPVLDVQRVAPYGTAERITSDPRGPKVHVPFRVWIESRGRTLAHHVGLELVLPRLVVNRELRRRMLDDEGLQLTQRPATVSFFRYHPQPVFPGQDLALTRFFVAVHAGNLALLEAPDATLTWRLYADDAPVRSGTFALHKATPIREAVAWVRQRATHPKR